MPQVMSDEAGITAWATTDEVAAITGVDETTITDEAINRAQYIIDMTSGRSFAMKQLLESHLHQRDLYYLKLATAYQTVWMMAQPDMFTRSDLGNPIQQDKGLSVSFMPGGTTLAPLAKRALRRLSWKGSRSQMIGRRGELTMNDFMNPTGPIVDQPGEAWSSLGGINDSSAIWEGD
jgi:hypothetical protein